MNKLSHFDMANTPLIYSFLCIKNLKPICEEMTELWQFDCQNQIEPYFLVW